MVTRAALAACALSLILGIAKSNPSPPVLKDTQIQDNIPDDVVTRRYLTFPAGEALDEESLQRSALALLAVGGSEEDEDYNPRKVLLATGSPGLRNIYNRYLARLGMFYMHNVYWCFGFMIFIFLGCSKGSFFGLEKLAPSKFVRFNVIQAVLMSIVIQCISVCLPSVPFTMRESAVGIFFTTSFFWGVVLTILYCLGLIVLGRYPKIPIVSEAARLQVMRGYQN